MIYRYPGFRSGASESKSGLVSNARKNPSIARPTMIFRASKNVCRKPTTSTSTERSTERSCRKVDLPRDAEFSATSGLDNLKKNLLAEGISTRAPNLITNNRRIPAINHYESTWKKWYVVCSEREISPTRSDINEILDFLAESFENWLKYRTIRTHRSSISVFLDPVVTQMEILEWAITQEYLPSCQVYSIRGLPNQSIVLSLM